MREPLLTLPEVADLLACSLATVKRRVRTGDIPTVRIGRLVRVRALDLDRYIAACVTRRAPSLSSLVGVTLAPGERLWD